MKARTHTLEISGSPPTFRRMCVCVSETSKHSSKDIPFLRVRLTGPESLKLKLCIKILRREPGFIRRSSKKERRTRWRGTLGLGGC
jgi:hypothetical protein